MGSGWDKCAVLALYKGFLRTPAAGHRWVAVASVLGASHHAEPEGSARRPVPSGELLAGHRDFGSGRAALEVVVAPQGALRGSGSPSRPLKR